MATYMPSPGQFRGADADPEATLELFTNYLEKMDKVFMVSRGYNPATGNKVDWTSDEKKAILHVEGGKEVAELFKYVSEATARQRSSSSSTPTTKVRSRLTRGTGR